VRRFIWEESAKEVLRQIEQPQALEILKALTRLAKGDDVGKVKKLTGDPHDYYRFRLGDWRVVFKYEEGEIIHVYAVGNRRDIYRR
jgi:mRNA interferase RelE/StbE